MNGRDKVVLYAEMNHGNDISEKELRLIIQNLEKRGFNGWYERVPANTWIQVVHMLGKIVKTGKNAWDSIE